MNGNRQSLYDMDALLQDGDWISTWASLLHMQDAKHLIQESGAYMAAASRFKRDFNGGCSFFDFGIRSLFF